MLNFSFRCYNGRRKETNMEFVKKSLSKWVQAILILVVGILTIVAGAQMGNTSMDALLNGNGSAETIKSISLVLGWSLIVIGSIGIVAGLLSTILSKAGFASAAITAGLTLAIGIWLVVRQEAGKLMFVLIGFVPYVMIVVGAVLFADAAFLVVNGIRNKALKQALPAAIIGALVAIASIVLGALCIATNEGGDTIIPSNVQLIIFGVILLIYACFSILATFVSLPMVTVVAVQKDEDDPQGDHQA